MLKRKLDDKLFNEAKGCLVGGVNSPVRSFKSVSGSPVIIKRGKGSKIYGEAGGSFIDYCLSWGAILLGHAQPEVSNSICQAARNGTSFGALTRLEIVFAKKLLKAFPFMEQVRVTNSGTEAVMAAVRLALNYSGSKKIIKFEGGFHGGGIPGALNAVTLEVPYNDLVAVEKEVKKGGVGAILIEPVAGNMGVVLPQNGFLKGLRQICDRNKIVLIFDEVITGFRVRYGGVQNLFGVEPDLTCLGKIIGGGLPVGAILGKREIMQRFAPEGPLVQSGTFSGNPVTVSAGIAALQILEQGQVRIYAELEKRTSLLCQGIRHLAQRHNLSVKVNNIGSMFTLFFAEEEVVNFQTANRQNKESFKKFFHGILDEGIYFSPSGFEANFLSTEHTEADIKKSLRAVEKVFRGGIL